LPYVYLDDDKKIFYLDEGPRDGRPVLLVHGWCATSALWSRQVPVLAADGYRVLALDSAGHGHSTKTFTEVRMIKLAETLDEFIRKTGVGNEKIALIGHSAGGGMAMAMYFRVPERIHCLGLLSTGYKMLDTRWRQVVWQYAPLVVEAAFHPVTKMFTGPMVNAFAFAMATYYGSDPREARRWFRSVHNTRGKIARREIEEITRYDIRKYLHKIDVPTLVIGGTRDLLAPGRQSEVMGELIPHAETHILPMNHIGKMFRSDLVNPILMEFLRRNYPADRSDRD